MHVNQRRAFQVSFPSKPVEGFPSKPEEGFPSKPVKVPYKLIHHRRTFKHRAYAQTIRTKRTVSHGHQST